MRIQPVPQTPEVETFTLVVVLRSELGFADAALEALEVLLRPYGEDLRVWRDGADVSVARVSIDCPSEDLDGALARGRDLAHDIVAASRPDVAVEEVVAMDDEQQLVWRAKP